MPSTRIEISYRTIVFTVIFILFLWFLYIIRSVIIALFVSLILMSALNPLVVRLEKKKIPRPLAILLLFAMILVVFSAVVASVMPPLLEQTRSLIDQTPSILERLGGLAINQQVISDQLGSVPSNIYRFLISTFSNLVALFTLFVLSYYFLSERGNLHRYLAVFFSNNKTEDKAEEFINKIEHHIGGWVRGQLALMVIIGVMTYIGLQILGVNYALPLAILAGLLEIIPNIGPTLSMIPAALIGATNSLVTMLATIALYFLIQQFENNIIVPKVMQKAVGVKPLVTIICLMVGLKLAGVLGIILAVPGYLILRLVVEEIYTSKRFRKA